LDLGPVAFKSLAKAITAHRTPDAGSRWRQALPPRPFVHTGHYPHAELRHRTDTIVVVAAPREARDRRTDR
jgi:hypothetical protein